MSDTFDLTWALLLAECPYHPRAERLKWAAWMVRRGYDAGLHGDLICYRIVDRIIGLVQEAAVENPAVDATLLAIPAKSGSEQDRPLTLWDRLVASWTEEEARLWLTKPHPLLNGAVPAELLAKNAADRLHRVLDELEERGFL